MLLGIYCNADPLLTEKQAAVFLSIKPQTLQVWRTTKRYPLSYVKVGRSVRYKTSELERFLVSNASSTAAGKDA